ncbi:MAG: hypothetical protein KDD62_14475, partial [Bdellovibrionales bacterium]|nr:hypothetical protein [Bdellovibrionales bacterium]
MRLRTFVFGSLLLLSACMGMPAHHSSPSWQSLEGAQQIQVAGVRIQVPPGNDWQLGTEYENGLQVKQVTFRKDPQSLPSGPTYTVYALIRPVGQVASIRSAEELVSFVKQNALQSGDFQDVKVQVKVGSQCAYPCVRYSMYGSKTGSRTFPLAEFKMRNTGYMFIHPERPIVFEVLVSERTPAERDFELS